MKQYVTETFVLNPPKFNFCEFDKFKNEIIFIKRNTDEYIPCLFIQDFNQCNKFLILFHGNNEDIFQLEMAAGVFREELKMNIIVVEYPGYSIYFSKKSPQIILEDTTIVYDYIKEKFNAKDEDIFIYGRSIGSAPSIFLASKRKAKALFVVSGFSSLKDVGKGLYVGWAMEDIFKNIEYIAQIIIPTLFIHGKKDSLISWEQSKKLYEKCPSNRKKIIYIENMSHNNYDLIQDILNNIGIFLSREISDMKRVNNHYSLYDSKFDNMLKTPKNILHYINSINFTLDNYTKIDKFFENINKAILLKDERIALVYDKWINICDTINFNKYYSIGSNYKIIFVDELKNGNLLYCTSDGNVNIIKIELTKYSKINTFKISQLPINNCKIIELENNDMMAIINDFYPLVQISQDKNSKEYIFDYIKIFQNHIINDIIDIENNRVAIVCCIKDLLFIYNYLNKTIYSHITIQFDNKSKYLYSNFLFFFKHQYLIVLKGINLVIYDVFNDIYYFRQFNLKYKSSNPFTITTLPFITTFCYFLNPFCLILGNSKGKLIEFNLETILANNTEEMSVSDSKIFNYKDSAIINILLLENKIMLLLSSDKILNIYHKSETSHKESCLIS